MNSECCCMVQKSLEICLTRETETHIETKDLSTQTILIPDAKATLEKHIKTEDKESALCCIDGRPPHSKVRIRPGEYSLEQSQGWT